MSDLTVGIDDVYPSESTAYHLSEPEEQKQEKKQEEGKNWAGKAQIEEIVERLQQRIDYYNSPDGIDVDVEDQPEVHQRKVLVNRALVRDLESELDYWKGKLVKQ